MMRREEGVRWMGGILLWICRWIWVGMCEDREGREGEERRFGRSER